MIELSEIKRLRRNLGLSQKELASHATVSQSLIAKIESGKIDPAFSKAQKILNTLNSMGKDQVCARDLMNRSLISVSPMLELKKAISKMKKYDISQLPVIDDRKAIGLISESIILDALINSSKPDDPVKTIMRDAPPIITKTASLEIVSHLLREYPIVIISEKGRLLGNITKSDILTKVFC